MNTAYQFPLDPARLEAQLCHMLKMQADMNASVFADWAARNLPWHRAIYVEAAEYLEHLGTWKWWKKGTPDIPQANMELVDIWHFALSKYLSVNPSNIAQVARSIVKEVDMGRMKLPSLESLRTAPAEVRHEAVDRLVEAAGRRHVDMDAFVLLVAASGMDFDELYRRYIGKNVLNRFRQENGYKTGTYFKVWDGREDNAHLEELLSSLDISECEPARVYAGLTARYQALNSKTN